MDSSLFRHPEVAAKRPSKGDGPGRASFEARFARTSATVFLVKRFAIVFCL
jgi:hypothetical protein